MLPNWRRTIATVGQSPASKRSARQSSPRRRAQDGSQSKTFGGSP
jgi:hypothetical protein